MDRLTWATLALRGVMTLLVAGAAAFGTWQATRGDLVQATFLWVLAGLWGVQVVTPLR